MKVGVFGVITPTSVSVMDAAMRIEEAGLDGLFLGEHYHLPVGSQAVYTDDLPDLYKHVPDPMMLLSAAAGVTTRITLGTTVSIAPIHDPLVLATQIGTLDMISAGRLIYGMGVGWNQPELANHGLEFATRRARLCEQIEAMKLLWSRDTAAFEGTYVRFTECWQGPKPVQQPHPPLLFGSGAGPMNFSVIADCCDGWIPTSLKQGDLHAELQHLSRTVERAGRDPGSLTNMMLIVEPGIYDTPPGEYMKVVTPELLEQHAALGFSWIAVGVPFFNRTNFAFALDSLRESAHRFWATT
jgi:probable F420-dependent oxidoreductase